MSQPEDVPVDAELVEAAGGAPVQRDELPLVARMVVEIRSDGTRTIARGAIDDRLGGEQVVVEAQAGSPVELASALARMIAASPRVAARAFASTAAPPGSRRRALVGRVARLIDRRKD